jgi:succinate-semialdehyde dehydrogenase/glutarate-semialdehyde dehydrogenase
MPLASTNPATGEKLKEFSPFDDAEIEKRLSRAEKAFKRYRRTTLTERAEWLHGVSDLLFQEKQTFAEIITLEMGKLFRDSVAEIEKCARGCRFYAENGARFLEEEPAQTPPASEW